MSKNKEELIKKTESLYKEIMLEVEKVNNGDISFSEIGEYFYDYFGDEISRILEELIEYFKDEKKRPVTMRVLSKEEGKILFDDLKKSKIKEGTFKSCGEDLKRIIEEQGL